MNKKRIVKKVLNNKEKYVKLCKEDLLANLFDSNNIVNKMSSIREIIKRVTGLELYPVQILGALELADGKIIEMKTGEGKTAVALAASMLLISNNKKVHLITVNEYLATRDAEFSRPVLEYIEKKCEPIISQTTNKKEIYDNVDLIYITNSELGFDYLRSNSAYDPEEIVYNNEDTFAIIDEADSVLIDEAKIPLILSIPKALKMEDYKKAQMFAKTLKNNDYVIEAKERRVYLTEEGAMKCQKYFNLDDYSSISSNMIRHLVDQALIANYIMKKDIDYIIKDNEVKLIDTNTGRIAEGRRFNRGLHQAIEAKENKEIKPETAVIGSITYQKLFGLYKNFGGMTGTIMSEKTELKEIYNKKPVKIPSNKPVIRKDEKDLFFSNNKDRDAYLLKLVNKYHKEGRPILIGTSSITESERVATVLKGFNFNLLNAKNDQNEAEIVARAGEKNAITIATNMAGRGTDIKLTDEVRELGGLALIGIGHYDFLRIDNQLRGRAGRQGDPGSSIFLVSLEDKLIDVFASDTLKNLIRGLIGECDEKTINNKGFARGVKKAQEAVATAHFNARKATTDYDNILEIYRQMFYKDRLKILKSNDILEKFNNEDLDVIKLKEIIESRKINLKEFILATMDRHWINFLSIAEDLKNESSYNSYSGTKSIVLYEETLGEEYDKMLTGIMENIIRELKKLAN